MRWMVVLGLVVAACGSEAAETTTTAVAPATTAAPVSTTSTTVSTTPAVPEPSVLAPGGGMMGVAPLRPGVYRYDLSVVPVDFELGEGWGLAVVTGRFVVFAREDVPIDPSLTFRPFDTPEAVVAELTTHQEAVEFTEPKARQVGGVEGVVMDVQFPENSVRQGPFRCNGPVLASGVTEGFGPVEAFVVGCSWNRFWVAGVGDGSVVVQVGNREGSPDEPGSLDGLESLIDEFLAGITFNP